jgi:hypothetical protein
MGDSSGSDMANPYYDHTTYPSNGAAGSSSALRSELDSIEAGFDKMPTLSGNGSKIIAVNSGASALEAITTTGTGDGVRATSPTLVTPNIGAATATSINGLGVTASTGTLTIANSKTLTLSNTLTFTGNDASSIAFGSGGTVAYTSMGLGSFAATSSAALAGVISDETGYGALVFGTSPTLVTPDIGTPSAGTLTNCTGLPIAGIASLGSGVGTWLATPSSANLRSAITDETGTGSLVFATSPTLITPNIGSASATTINGLTLTSSTGTLTIANGKTATINNTITLSGTDGTTMTLPSTSATLARTDTGQTFTGTNAFGTLTATTVNGHTFTAGSSTFTGTAGQTYTFPTTSATLARTDAANAFVGAQTITSTSAGASTMPVSLWNASNTANTEVVLDLTPSTSSPGNRCASIAALNNGSNQIDLIVRLSNAGSPSEVARFNYQGRFYIGPTASASLAGDSPRMQIAGANGDNSCASILRYSNDANQSNFYLGKSRGASIGTNTIVQSGDEIGALTFVGADGTGYIRAAKISAHIDGTPGTNDMPGRIVFSTTADGASSPTERMRIDQRGGVGIGTTATAGYTVEIGRNITGNTLGIGIHQGGVVQSDVTSQTRYFNTFVSTVAASFTLSNLMHYMATQSTIGAGSTVTNQYGFRVESSLTGATNNFAFYGDIASGTGRYNLYMNGTAANYFAGDMQFDKTITAGGTTGAQTINKNAGSVNFGAAATSLVVTDSRVTTSSVIICTVATNDSTMHSAKAVAASGSFTIHANAAATAETRVNFLIIN